MREAIGAGGRRKLEPGADCSNLSVLGMVHPHHYVPSVQLRVAFGFLAGTRLNTRVRRQVDPEDVVQALFRSFFDRQAAGQFELENWNSLWSLLVRIAVRKGGAGSGTARRAAGRTPDLLELLDDFQVPEVAAD